MAKLKGKGVVVAGLIAGAASLLSKKENRDKLMDYVNQTKEKVNANGGVQGLVDKVKNATGATGTSTDTPTDAGGPSSSAGNFTTDDDHKEDTLEKTVEEKLEDAALQADTSSTTELEGNHFVEEGGAHTLIDAFNEQQDDKK